MQPGLDDPSQLLLLQQLQLAQALGQGGDVAALRARAHAKAEHRVAGDAVAAASVQEDLVR